MAFCQRHFFTLKTFLRAIIFINKVVGTRRIQSSQLSSQPNRNAKDCFAWKRITLDDIDSLWRKSGKLDAPLKEQLDHFALSVETILKNEAPDQYRLNWQCVTQSDIDRQWGTSSLVHPAFGRQLCHFAVGIERISKDRNLKSR